MLLDFIFEKDREKRKQGRREEDKREEGRKQIKTTYIYLPGMVGRSNEVDDTKALLKS